MENIKRQKETILSRFSTRRSKKEKEDFRTWLIRELKKTGYTGKEESYGKYNASVNVIAGNPDQAKVFFIAHYDAPRQMLVPNFISPTNVVLHVGYHFFAAVGLFLVILLLSVGLTFLINAPQLTLPLTVIFAVAALLLSSHNFFNITDTANDNSSGILALLSLARRMENSQQACFVFLDNNVHDQLGAKAFQKMHPNARDKLYINFDCVGIGEHLLLIPSKYSRWDVKLLQGLKNIFSTQTTEKFTSHILEQGLQYYPSDHRKFKYHLAVTVCRYAAGVGYYIPNFTKRNTEDLSTDLIEQITDKVKQFFEEYNTKEDMPNE